MKFGQKVLRELRAVVLMLMYTLVVSGSVYIAYDLRFDFAVPPEYRLGRWRALALLIPTKLVLLVTFRQFRSLLTYFSIHDMLRIVVAMASGSIVLYFSRGFVPNDWIPPRGVILIDVIISVVGLCSLRLLFRLYRERFADGRYELRRNMRRIAILGAGDAGANLASEALSKPHLGLRPIFFLDDDRAKHGRLIHGIPVFGRPEDVTKWIAQRPVDACIIAMPSAGGRRVQEIVHIMNTVGLKVEIVPSMAELATGRVTVSKIRPVDVVDLLGRQVTDLRAVEVKMLVEGKTVMITGAGGSIGGELCRQIAACNPQRLLLVERCEVQMFQIEQELLTAGYGSIVVPMVADILDSDRMKIIFDRFKPNIVFHAAAHKHVPMMEHQPYEALKNNTVGTQILANLSSQAGVDRFILISTDKAINPTNVMGASKRLAELYLQALQARNGTQTKFMAVRFGNVLDSSGSVIPTFRRQIATGGPVTVTHPDVTRYFMTIPEAVGLVLRAATLGVGGEIFVLDMGKPIKIAELARQLIELSGFRPNVDIEIQFTGLRPGEKLFEELNHGTENMVPTTHAKIMRFNGQASDLTMLDAQLRELEVKARALEADQVKREIRLIVPEYQPYLAVL